MATEHSVLSSLGELRAIEQERIASERAEIERAKLEVVEIAKAEEAARREAEEAKLRAEREERIRVAEARAAAERDARLRAEAVEAAERARIAAQIQERRLAEEMALRREVIAKQRPRWMVAVTAIAIVGALGFGAFAYTSAQRTAEANRLHDQAIADREAAKQQAHELAVKVEAAQRDLDEVQQKIDRSLDEIRRIQDHEQLVAAQKHLAELAEEKRIAQKKIDDANAAKAKQDRDKPVDMHKCQGVLGCIDRK